MKKNAKKTVIRPGRITLNQDSKVAKTSLLLPLISPNHSAKLLKA